MSSPELIDVVVHTDDRGHVYVPMDLLNDKGIKRTYIVENFSKGTTRAWHGHRKADTYMFVLEGAVKLAAMNMDNPDDILIKTVTARNPKLFYVPAGYYNGATSLTDDTKILVYSTLSFDEVRDDDHRLAWNVRGQIWGVQNR